MRKVSYLPLWHLLLERGMTKSQMRIEAGLTTNVLANMNKGQHISMDSLIRICDALDCNLNDMWVHSPPLGAQANFNRIEKRDTM